MENVSSETNELISYGGGVGVENIFIRDKQDYLVWGWRKFSSETNEIILYGGGVGVENIVKGDKRAHLVWKWSGGREYFQMRNLQ